MTEQTKFSLLFFLKALGDAIFIPFLSLYLVSLNFTGPQLGFALSLGPIVGLLANPFWGAISKDIGKSKSMLRNLFIVVSLTYIAFSFIKSYNGIIILLILLPFFSSPLIPLVDSFGVTFCNLNKLKFGQIRIWASIGFMITTFLGGIVAKHAGYNTNFYIAACVFLIASYIVFLIKDFDVSKNTDKKQGSFKEILHNHNFIKYLLFYVFILGSNSIAEYYFGIYLDQHGKDSSIFGILTSLGVLAEIITMRYIMTRGIRIKENVIFLIVSIILITRMVVFTNELPYVFTVIVSLIKGVGIGLFLSYHMDYVFKIVRINNLTLATFMIFICHSLFLSIFNNISGYVYEFYGLNVLYFFLTLLGLIGLLFAPFLKVPKAVNIE